MSAIAFVATLISILQFGCQDSGIPDGRAKCPLGHGACTSGGDNMCVACEAAGGTIFVRSADELPSCVCIQGAALLPMSVPWEEDCTPQGVVYSGNIGRYCNAGLGLIPAALPLSAAHAAPSR